MMMLDLGAPLPDVTATGADGVPLPLRRLIGKPLIIYFYPKDDTPGCTREAQDFSAAMPALDALGVQVLGISKDSPAKHAKFTQKYALTVPLASDGEDNAVLEAFGVWVQKSMYGKTYLGIARATFLFDARGALVRAWPKVTVPGHVAAVLAAAQALG